MKSAQLAPAIALTGQQGQDFSLGEETDAPIGAMRPISQIGVDISSPTPDDLPVDDAKKYLNPEGLQVYYGVAPFQRSLSLHPLTRTAAFCHQPLYFEEVNLERYGTTPRRSAAGCLRRTVLCAVAAIAVSHDLGSRGFATITNIRSNRARSAMGE